MWISVTEYNQLQERADIAAAIRAAVSQLAEPIWRGAVALEGVKVELRRGALALEGIRFGMSSAPGRLTIRSFKQIEGDVSVATKFLQEVGLLDGNADTTWAKRVVTITIAGVEVFKRDLGTGPAAVGVLRDEALVGSEGDEIVGTLVDFDAAGNPSDPTTFTGTIADTVGPEVASGTFGVRSYAQIEVPEQPVDPDYPIPEEPVVPPADPEEAVG